MSQQYGGVVGNGAAWAMLVGDAPLETLGRGKPLYTPEQPATELFVIAEGQVALSLAESARRTLSLRVAQPGDLLGLVALAGEPTYDSFAEVLKPLRFYRLQRDLVLQQVEQDGTLALALLEALGAHRQTVSRRLDEVAFKSVPARLASVLLGMADSPEGAHPSRVPRHSHRQLAEMVNAYRETVTKVINQFVAARLLEIDRYTFTLVNRSGLEELAQGW